MPDQFVVPQFLDVEPKIIGPITGRQFLILLSAVLASFTVFRIFRSPVIFIPLIIFIVGTAIAFAFAKVNGQAFHFIALNMIQTLRRPAIRVWDKTLTDAELKDRLKNVQETEVAEPRVVSKPLHNSRLSELSLIVDAGGAYEPEGDLVKPGFYGESE